MAIEIIMVRSRADSESYIRLPFRIYNAFKEYVPPLLRDERRFHDPKFNRSLWTCDTIRLLAKKEGVVVGRVMGIIHHEYNQKHGLQDVRFFQLDSIQEKEVATKLVEAVMDWGQAFGMKRIIGPFGFSDKDPQGIQLEGREIDSVVSSASNPSYIADFIEELGFIKLKDCVSYLWDIQAQLPTVYEQVAKRLERNGGFVLLSFESRNQLRPHFKTIMELLNRGYEQIFGFVAMSEAEIDYLAKEYLGFINPRFVKMIANQDHQIIAFVIAMPNIASGFQKAKGSLFPLGLWHLYKAMRKSQKLDLLLGSVDPKYQRKGLTSLLAMSLIQEARKSKFKTMDSHLILEENIMMCAEMERLGSRLAKRYRIFQKSISN